MRSLALSIITSVILLLVTVYCYARHCNLSFPWGNTAFKGRSGPAGILVILLRTAQ